MAVTFLEEMRDSPSLSIQSQPFEGGMTATRKFRLRSDDIADGNLTVLANVNLPQSRDSYVYNSEQIDLLRVVDRTAEREVNNPLYWIATIEYETSDEEWENPLGVVDISGGTYKNQVPSPYSVDNSGNPDTPFTSSAGEPILENLPQKNEANGTLTIVRNESISVNPLTLQATYANKISSAVFQGAAAGSCYCDDISFSLESQNLPDDTKLEYWAITYQFLFGDFSARYLDKGNFYLSGGNKVNFKTVSGETYQGLLDGAGAASATPVLRGPYQQYGVANFNNLSLPAIT